MDTLIVVLLVLVGLINFAPLVGMVSARRLEAIYGLPVRSPDLAVLLRHRALLFGLVGGLALVSVALPELRVAALTMCGVSMLGYIVIAAQERSDSPALRKLARIDVVGLALAAAAGVAMSVAG